MIGLDLFLSIECNCKGYIHELTCDIQSKLPTACNVTPNRWLVQFGKFLVRDELFDPNSKPVVPYKSFREFGATLKTPVKKNSKEEGTYFVDIEIATSAKNFMDWVVNELEKTYGQIKYQNRLHLVLTNQQWKRIADSSRHFGQFKGTVRCVILAKEHRGVNVKVKGIDEQDIIWKKTLRPMADTTVDVGMQKKPRIHRFKKQCLVGGYLILLFMVMLPAGLYFYSKYGL